MKRLRAWIRFFFGFSRKESNAFVILIPLMTVMIFSEPAYRYWFVRQDRDFTKDKAELDSIVATWKPNEIAKPKARNVTSDNVVARLFLFNPNSATKNDLTTLGFAPKLAERLIKYRTSGGKFVVKGDLMKVYGMDSSFYKKINAYIELPDRRDKPTTMTSPRKEAPVKFDLNLADTTQLATVYGIGPKLSQRIVAYRTKLGGFVNATQLSEVYGLDSIVVKELLKKSFVAQEFLPTKLDVNTASEAEMARHPYIKYKLAKAIAAYRFQHGGYRTVEELRKIALIDESTFQKIKPYLSVNP